MEAVDVFVSFFRINVIIWPPCRLILMYGGGMTFWNGIVVILKGLIESTFRLNGYGSRNSICITGIFPSKSYFYSSVLLEGFPIFRRMPQQRLEVTDGSGCLFPYHPRASVRLISSDSPSTHRFAHSWWVYFFICCHGRKNRLFSLLSRGKTFNVDHRKLPLISPKHLIRFKTSKESEISTWTPCRRAWSPPVHHRVRITSQFIQARHV